MTTGGSSLDAVGALRDAGADRDRLPGHHDLRVRRRGRGVRRRRRPADRADDVATIVDEATASGALDRAAADDIHAWLADPALWSARIA